MADAERPWRCFVAVPIGSDLRDAVDACVRDLHAHPGADAFRWTDAEGWHVTLAFLGATQPAVVPSLVTALTRVAESQVTFTLDAGGLGAFPSRRRARVLWYGVADPDGSLRSLARTVRSAVGLPPGDRFRGHLTLARARDRFGADASALLAVPAPDSFLTVDRLVLFRSHVGRGPARYEQLASATLPDPTP